MNLIAAGGSWSGRERNCCFLNTGQLRFANVSAVTGLDYLDDGRCVAPVDWDQDGDLDLWMVSRTAPAIRFVRNESNDGNHWISFRLQGTESNRDAIGTRVTLKTDGKVFMRTARSGNGYLSQSSRWIHFGLGENTQIDEVEFRWPNGQIETIKGVQVDHRYFVKEGSNTAEKLSPSNRELAIAPNAPSEKKAGATTRIAIRDKVPMPALPYRDSDDVERLLTDNLKRPVLVSLWATWCAPCLVELREMANHEDELRELGIDVLALNVELAVAPKQADVLAAKASKMISETLKFPFRTGYVTADGLETLDAIQEVLISLRGESGQLPSSFLVDRFGRLRFIYTGELTVDQLLRDSRIIQSDAPTRDSDAFPFSGRWTHKQDNLRKTLIELTLEFDNRKLTQGALNYGRLAAELSSRQAIPTNERIWLSTLFFNDGISQLNKKKVADAGRSLQESVRLRPDWAEAHANLGIAYRELSMDARAIQHLQQAIQLRPDLVPAHLNLGIAYSEQSDLRQAAQHFEAVTEIDPSSPLGFHRLGVCLYRLGYRTQGLQALRQAAQLAPTDEEVQTDLKRALKGERF